MIHQFQCNACGSTWFETDRHGLINFHACGPLPPDKKNLERERPDKRDENIAVDRTGTVLGIKLEGAGVTCLTDSTVEAPRWLSTMNKRIEVQEEEENA